MIRTDNEISIKKFKFWRFSVCYLAQPLDFSFGRGLVKASVTLQGKDRDGICPSGVEKITYPFMRYSVIAEQNSGKQPNLLVLFV